MPIATVDLNELAVRHFGMANEGNPGDGLGGDEIHGFASPSELRPVNFDV
jgi:hypothetical protein